ncbi:MAG: AAA family ATPase [Nitriliruptorales bacterium]
MGRRDAFRRGVGQRFRRKPTASTARHFVARRDRCKSRRRSRSRLAFSPVWPADAYGVVAAEDKAGKTWASLDAAVSVASGSRWMGEYVCAKPGAVLGFLGEGGERKMVRRLRAIGEARGVVTEYLPIRLCFRVPHLTSEDHVAAIGAELGEYPARLVIVDPLYLAARGARGSDLYEMGAHLERVQHVVQEAGAALVIVCHWMRDRRKGP